MNLYTSKEQYLESRLEELQKLQSELIEAIRKLGYMPVRTQNGIELISAVKVKND